MKNLITQEKRQKISSSFGEKISLYCSVLATFWGDKLNYHSMNLKLKTGSILLSLFLTITLSFNFAYGQEASSTPSSSDPVPTSTGEIVTVSTSTSPQVNNSTSTEVIDVPIPAPVVVSSSTSASAPSTQTTTIIDNAINAVKKIFDQSNPDRIADLHVISASSKRVSVGWTIPFDDSGKIAGYEARLLRAPLSESNWNQAISFGGTPGEGKTGEKQVMDFSDLPENAELYIAIKAVDPVGKMSAISNVIVTRTKSGGGRESPSLSSIRVPQGINDSVGQVAGVTSKNGDLEYGTVSATIVTADGLPSPFPVFVNFINTSTGLSYGGPTVNGLASYKIPTGDYYVRLVVTDTQYKEPANPPTFTLAANEDKNIGNINLVPKGLNEKTDQLLSEASKQGGVAKMLVTIIRLLSEMLDTLQKIAFKLNVEN